MFGRKTGFFAAMALTVMLLGGCGSTANNLGGATDGYHDAVYGNTTGAYGEYGMYGTGLDDNGTNAGTGVFDNNTARGGLAYWDGYGINTGRNVTGTGTERSTYGVRKDVDHIGDGIERAVDDLTQGNTKTNSMVN